MHIILGEKLITTYTNARSSLAMLCDQVVTTCEPVKHFAAGAWSRRLSQEHRVVYLVSKDRIDFLQARYHY
ncbi:MAG: Txe/YoeB family addiction module toxin [Candidatus Latescibacteria bacterium]|nr:Txe/YoeB family addiction module toxin [Candidatus Latescibacterota bacterium]